MRVSLSNLPSQNKTYAQNFPSLTGGLNLRDLHIDLKASESPSMKNMWWQDGVLQARDGQVWLSDDESRGTGLACYESLFWGYAFFHIGSRLYCADPAANTFALTELATGVTARQGTFFRWGDWLFYKNFGGFYRIGYDPEQSRAPFVCENVVDTAYTPVILLNADPETGAGDTYQPENRLSADKTVRYNARAGVKAYKLPVTEIEGIVEVLVDGVQKSYTVDLAAGVVTFAEAPPVTEPATNNTVEITYRKSNTDAYDAIMECELAFVSGGGDQNLCILLAGCDAQPNAVFWNSNDNVSMNAGYWPISYYNLVGDTEDEVTGFGKQYSDTIVLKKHSIGKLTFGTQTLDGRESISFTYQNINSRVGCDLPGSIQLIENNLVFCNTYRGVHILRSSSAAYENNVECISDKVNGSTVPGMEAHHIKGLIRDLRAGARVSSFDDDQRYWLCANGHAWLWDYSLSTYSDPSWFYFEGIGAVSFFADLEHDLYHLDELGRVTKFMRNWHDYGNAFEKRYQFPVLNFGGYERKKDITSLLLAVRSDTESTVTLQYDTDYETRLDQTEINTWHWEWKDVALEETILGYYNLETARYAKVVRRNPGCRNIRHFTLTLSNAEPGQDLAIVSAQIFYRFKGKER